MGETLVEVKDIKMYFPVTSGILIQRKVADVKAVDNVSFNIRRGETLGLVGESGCGKTTLGRVILLLYKPTAGSIKFRGQDLEKMKGGDLRRMRRYMQMIFQDPYASLNPRMTVGDLIGEAFVIQGMAPDRADLGSLVHATPPAGFVRDARLFFGIGGDASPARTRWRDLHRRVQSRTLCDWTGRAAGGVRIH